MYKQTNEEKCSAALKTREAYYYGIQAVFNTLKD